jgi:uncharacterized secreted protein with C-terminal beta-propeller domain
MEDNISFIDNDQIEDKIKIILGQTDYTEDIIREKLKSHNYDHLAVIRSYFGIIEKKEQPIKSVNQEIYKQLRHRLDTNMRNYQERHETPNAKKM